MESPLLFRTAPARALVLALLAGALSVLVPVSPASAAVPPTTAGLSAAIEDPQPYVGQSTCDPVAKPGVAAFRDLLLRTYAGTTSLGIVRDCGIGGQSEHKEGRAFDWGVSASNPTQVQQVDALFAWLFKTDQYGNAHAMVRRLGIMYIIWNNQIWRAYSNTGWQPYTGADPHTGHVHFSFGWAGARKVTSYWDATVAPIDYGPNAVPVYTAVPFRSPDNIAVLRSWGGTTLRSGSSGAAVVALQKALKLTADGAYGPATTAAVNRFKTAQKLAADGTFGPDAWKALFLPPVTPFGTLALARTPGGITVSGWAVDADTPDPLRTTVRVDNVQVAALTASLDRPDVAAAYPASGAAHGYSVLAPVGAGVHSVCTYAVNAPGTPGDSVKLGCASLTVGNEGVGRLDPPVTTFGSTTLSGWALDPDTTDPVDVRLLVDGAPATTLTATGTRAADPAWTGYGANHGFSFATTLTEGTHSVCAVAVAVAPGGDGSLGCQPVTVRHSPTGSLDHVTQVPGGSVEVAGFALDPDATAPVPVAVTWDGTRADASPADASRGDLSARYPGYGADHGFVVSKALAAGTHTVCVIASNSPGTLGAEASLGCRTVTVAHSPLGAQQVLRTQPGGTVLLSGWALDPDVTDPATATRVVVNVDSRYLQTLTAGVVRNDLPTGWARYGTAHGFTSTLQLPAGTHQVCSYPLNTPGTPGARTLLSCATVLVGTPHGTLEFASPSPGRVNVRGWALDPDTTKQALVSVVLDGRTVALLTANTWRTDVGATNPGYGAGHGYATTVAATPGRHTLCTYARNIAGTPGSSVRLGCKSMLVR
jgi:peptidoglycan hydrolase-like protein with peptidoglycan-binding domain